MFKIKIGKIKKINEELYFYGWIEDKRELGKIIFLTIKDFSGEIQVVVKKQDQKDLWEISERIPRQSIIRVDGKSVDNKGKIEIVPSSITLINEAIHPLPLDPSGRVKANISTYLDYRPLTLRIPEKRSIFRIKSKLLHELRSWFIENEYLEITTPKIISAAAEGGAELFQIKYFNLDAYLAQSPQLYKEQLMLSVDKVFEIAQYYRAEKSHTTRHVTEFTSVDIEISFADYLDVIKTINMLIQKTTKKLIENTNEELKILEVMPPQIEEKTQIITYKECVDFLNERDFELKWGDDIGIDALKILAEDYPGYYYIIDWPTETKPFYIKSKNNDKSITESFDFMFGPTEIASGGTRIHNKEELEDKLRSKGLDVNQFKQHTKFYDYGMPPHSGFGLGFDRLLQIMIRSENIREVILYPRDPERLIP